MPFQIPNAVIVVLQVILAFAGAFLLAFWISLVVWTFRDARARSRDIFAQMLAVLMAVAFGPAGLLLYLLLRPKETLSELYERSLSEEALLQDLEERALCPGCKRRIEPDFLFCPECHTRLKKGCPQCSHLLHLKWNLCPYCGATVAAYGQPAAQSPEEVVTDMEVEPEFLPEPRLRVESAGETGMEPDLAADDTQTW
jgi:RNA polymerase subunit RPABC4/transcription elongation factor Spt4